MNPLPADHLTAATPRFCIKYDSNKSATISQPDILKKAKKIPYRIEYFKEFQKNRRFLLHSQLLLVTLYKKWMSLKEIENVRRK